VAVLAHLVLMQRPLLVVLVVLERHQLLQDRL
jgi:hypothetical protein